MRVLIQRTSSYYSTTENIEIRLLAQTQVALPLPLHIGTEIVTRASSSHAP